MPFPYLTLWDEIKAASLGGDPLGRGYDVMSAASAASNLGELTASQLSPVIDPGAVYNAVEGDEWDNLSAACQAEFYNIVHIGTTEGLDTGAGTRARSQVLQIFGPASSTVDNMLDAARVPISRATQIGLPVVKEGHVLKARAQFGGG